MKDVLKSSIEYAIRYLVLLNVLVCLCSEATSRFVGELIAKKAIEAGITSVVFDRNGYLYHGRIKAVADAARNAGLKF